MSETPEVTEKEKERAMQNEKEQDTKVGTPENSAKKGRSRPESSVRTDSAKSKPKSTPKGSRAGSPKGEAASRGGSPKGKAASRGGSPKGKAASRGGSPKGKAASRGGSPKGKAVKGKAQKTKPKAEEEKPETEPAEQDDSGPPAGVVPLFLAGKTQEIFSCVCDENVTADMPFKLIPKEDIIADLRARAAISDFSVVKQIVQDYPGDELLIIYDSEFKYGQNFLFATNEEAKERMLNPPEEVVEGAESGKEDEDDTVYKYIPPESKPWLSLGSEKEIDDENVKEHRKKIEIRVQRTRREFGAPVTFSDRNVSDAKDGYMECASYEDKLYDVNKIEVEQGTQAVPELTESGTQTDWKHPRNANTQYYPREFTDEEKEKHLQSEELNAFLKESVPRFKLALQQNEIMDVFYDDWYNLSDHDGTFGGKADNHLKEYQSFTDLQFSKEKTVTCINWHPTIRGVVAVAIAEKVSFDDRVDHSSKIIMSPSLVLIWSFVDPIHPQLLLEAPDDIESFQFCPTNPNIIAGGCINGQLVLWDISGHSDKLRQSRTVSKSKGAMTTLESFDNETKLDSPIVRYAAVSSIDHSHKAAITDILWVPDHMELSRMGVPMENSQGQCVQVMTAAADHSVLIWDTRPPKAGFMPDNKLKAPMGVPTTFRYLELTWKPMLKVTLNKSEPGGDHAPTKFSIQEVQGNKDVLGTGTMDKDERNTAHGEFQFNKPSSAKEKKSLQGVKTHFFVGTEDGEIVYVDWMPQKDQDTGKIQTLKPDFYSTIHDGPVVALQRSPFYRDIVLSVGGWTFTVWKEGVQSGPILTSTASNKRLTGGAWSPSRPGVFFIARIDGSIDVWDLLDRTHEPSLNQSISSAAITSIVPFQVTAKQHLLGVGDGTGTLHVLEIPWSLRMPTPNEHQLMANYFEREVKRRGYVVKRWDFRENEKREIEAEIKKKAGIAPNIILTDEEIEYRQKLEYNAFVEEETIFLRELGLKEDDDEPLPET